MAFRGSDQFSSEFEYFGLKFFLVCELFHEVGEVKISKRYFYFRCFYGFFSILTPTWAEWVGNCANNRWGCVRDKYMDLEKKLG